MRVAVVRQYVPLERHPPKRGFTYGSFHTDDHASMVSKFEKVMVKLATLGQNPRALTDCSEVIPVPKNVRLPPPTLPAGKTLKDVEAAVRDSVTANASCEVC